MKSVFVGHFRPTQEEFTQLWNDSIFAIDANVLLNLYRYSSATKEELEKALRAVENKVFITHQAAKEFLRNRLKVTADHAGEYQKTIKSIEGLSDAFLKENKHPFLLDDDLKEFEQYSKKLISTLKKQEELLFAKLTDDEILDFIEKLFAGKTGQPFNDETLTDIAKEGEERYNQDIPPGYKDSKKDNTGDTYRKYGDLMASFIASQK